MSAAYPLEALLGIRERRADDRRRDLALRQAALAQARAALDEAVRQCEEYRKYMDAEISARSDRLIGQTLGKEALEEFKRGLESLKFKLADLELAAERARGDLRKAADEEKQARACLREAVLETEKIKAHRKIWQAAQRLEQERAEDLELEDFSPRKPPAP